ncbi:MAG: dihydrofolate reductase family protein [Frankia sp.]|nr:dihydrofolate reductase family protein [Frankia sp.]
MSCAMSLDGRIDDASPTRLILSNEADLDRVDGLRAGCDAILVGAGTVRRDDPRLLVRSARRRAERVAAGLPPTPAKVVVTAGAGPLDPGARVFAADPPAERLVYCPPPAAAGLRARLAGVGAEIVPVPPVPQAAPPAPAAWPAGIDAADGGVAAVAGAVVGVDPRAVLADLAARGVRRLLVEGGTTVHTTFLTAGLVDELQLVIAPFFVGDEDAPRFVGPGRFPHGPHRPLRLAEARPIGDVVLLRYLAEKPGCLADKPGCLADKPAGEPGCVADRPAGEPG